MSKHQLDLKCSVFVIPVRLHGYHFSIFFLACHRWWQNARNKLCLHLGDFQLPSPDPSGEVMVSRNFHQVPNWCTENLLPQNSRAGIPNDNPKLHFPRIQPFQPSTKPRLPRFPVQEEQQHQVESWSFPWPTQSTPHFPHAMNVSSRRYWISTLLSIQW